jgi:hypothetical protein
MDLGFQMADPYLFNSDILYSTDAGAAFDEM